MREFMRTYRMLRAVGCWGFSVGWLEIIWLHGAFRFRLFERGVDLGYLWRRDAQFSCREGYCSCWHVGRFSVSRL